MAYGNSNTQRSYGNNSNRSGGNYNNTARSTDKREEPVLSKFMRATKSGKSIAFLTGDKAITIPANTRVVVTPISEKRKAALEKSAKEKGFQGSVPTHELVVFPVEIKAAK